ncbi:MAG: hypothetical protein J5761_02280 [Paludibacteraceae bacterium]|nr:hypothetical protein [Paludibacteraceae bacterium]
MKKLFCSMLVVCLAMSAWAADLPKQGFGVHVGWAQPILRLNRSTNPASAKDSLTSITKMNGFKVGLTYDGSYIAGFGSSMGINYTFATSNSGWKAIGVADYPRSRQMIHYHEVEMFVDWQYKFEVAKETYLILYTGPTIQCGIGMDMRTDRQEYDGTITYKHGNGYNPEKDDYTSLDEENNHFKRMNVTWGVGAGFQYQRYFVRGGYDFGLINPYANSQFVDKAGIQMDRYTRGRLDQWSIKIGMYLWYE